MSKYALTVDEREWLYVRKINLMESNVYRYFIDMDRYGLPDYMDAAEFEARVSRYIARNASNCNWNAKAEWEDWHNDGFTPLNYEGFILREARIAVEEEMDNADKK